MLPATLLHLLTSTLSWLNYERPTSGAKGQTADLATLRFELRHIHAVSPEARVVWADISQSNDLTSSSYNTPYYARTKSMKSSRPTSYDAFARARSLSRIHRQSAILDWDEEEIIGPDVESRDTLVVLAKMTNDAYLQPSESGWYDLGSEWNVVSAGVLTIPFLPSMEPADTACMSGLACTSLMCLFTVLSLWMGT